GLELNCKRGNKVNVGDIICYVYHDEDLKQEWIDELYNAFEFTDEDVENRALIEKILS
ncbi:MAG: pyrimidine-nucleoside phosphorylase, partial [Intestinibacter sp.]